MGREGVLLQQRQLGGAPQADNEEDVLRARPPAALLAAPMQQVVQATGSMPGKIDQEYKRDWACSV